MSTSDIDFTVIIPARYASTRLPGKPLEKIVGKTMIEHVYDRAVSSGASQVIIATDDKRIQQVAESFGAQVQMTSSDHTSGSDRIAEVVERLEFSDDQVVVNLQGDELFMPASLIRQVASNLVSMKSGSTIGMATLKTAITKAEELFDPNVVKVVVNMDDCAVYFSRAPIPWDRETLSFSQITLPANRDYYRHIGIYAYRSGFLKQFVSWSPAPIEMVESLEQLRVLWNDYKIHVAIAEELPYPGVDTPEDLEKAIKNYQDKLKMN